MLQSEVTCQVCKTSSKKHDPFLDLSIDIPNQFVQYRKNKEKDPEGRAERKNCNLHGILRLSIDPFSSRPACVLICDSIFRLPRKVHRRRGIGGL